MLMAIINMDKPALSNPVNRHCIVRAPAGEKLMMMFVGMTGTWEKGVLTRDSIAPGSMLSFTIPSVHSLMPLVNGEKIPLVTEHRKNGETIPNTSKYNRRPSAQFIRPNR